MGEAIIVYREVTQFDTVTGPNAFRANVDGVKHKLSYGFADCSTNTSLTTESADLGDIVQDDLFQAEVIVAGSLSYETTLGGSTTVPKLTVIKITIIGSTKWRTGPPIPASHAGHVGGQGSVRSGVNVPRGGCILDTALRGFRRV